MHHGTTIEELSAARGRPVVGSDGTRLGDVDAIYYDNETDQPEWIGIATGFIATNRVVVPAEAAKVEDDAVRVPYDQATVKAAPTIDGDEISPELERNLYRHYGLDYSEREQRIEDVRSEADTEIDYAEGAPADDETYREVADTAATDASVTRSEEELLVGKREVEAGRVRVRKWVETEPVAVDIELQHERARVVREDINEPADGADFGDQELEITLRAEEPMVEKQVIAKERIRLETDVHVETATVSDEVRKERVEVEGADDDVPA
jgi:stress response protein YsnF